ATQIAQMLADKDKDLNHLRKSAPSAAKALVLAFSVPSVFSVASVVNPLFCFLRVFVPSW
ncbi:MAG TPA: hypothetical protein VIM11_11845, partial [Tepidisphaeraceae bacterium]